MYVYEQIIVRNTYMIHTYVKQIIYYRPFIFPGRVPKSTARPFTHDYPTWRGEPTPPCTITTISNVGISEISPKKTMEFHTPI